jgi:transcriptional/translational regulatory protein YebC/TACO1
MADAGSVMFQFSRKGVIRVKDYSEDNLLVALDAGAEDAADEEGELVVYTDQKDLAKVRQNMIDNGLEIIQADLQYVPNNLVEVSEDETAEKIMKLMDLIDDHDDVVDVYTNADLK